jgi:hypothetical protein
MSYGPRACERASAAPADGAGRAEAAGSLPWKGGPRAREMSPAPGGCTLIASAPKSASLVEANGRPGSIHGEAHGILVRPP